MIVLQYDPYRQTAKFQSQNEENGCISNFKHLLPHQKDELDMLEKDIILQNQIENLVRVLKEIDSSQRFRFIGTLEDYRDFCEGLKQLAPEGDVKWTDSQFFHGAPYIRKQLASLYDAVRRGVEDLNRKYPEHSSSLCFDSTGVDATIKGRTPLVFMGSGSAGKSSVINALIGAEVLPTGDGTTTEAVCEIIPAANDRMFEVSYKRGDDEIKFDLTSSKEDIEQKLKDVLGAEASFDTENRYEWMYKIIEIVNQQDCIEELRICVPFKNLRKISGEIVIYDTPGPDSKTRLNHKSILNEALSRFKKGVAIFVTRRTEIEKTNLRNFLKSYIANSELLLEILNVNAGIVVVNGADESNISKINEGKESRNRHLEETENELIKKEFLYEQDRMIYFATPYALAVHENLGDRWMDSGFRRANRHTECMDDPDDEDYLPLASVAELPFLRKQEVYDAYKKAEDRYLAERSEENRKRLIAHNSGLRALEHEIGFVVTKLSIFNLCVQAQKQLESVLQTVKDDIEKIGSEISNRNENYRQEFKKDYQDIVTKLFGDSPDSLLKKAREDIKKTVERVIGSEDDLINRATEQLRKKISNDWAKVKRAPKEKITNIILSLDVLKEILEKRNKDANDFYAKKFESFKENCLRVVYENEYLSDEERAALEKCVEEWSPVNLDESKAQIDRDRLYNKILFIKFADKKKCSEEAGSTLTSLLRDQKLRVIAVIKEIFETSCQNASEAFFTDERIQTVNPKLKALSEKIALLEEQQKEYEEFQVQVEECLEKVSRLTELQQKGTV